MNRPHLWVSGVTLLALLIGITLAAFDVRRAQESRKEAQETAKAAKAQADKATADLKALQAQVDGLKKPEKPKIPTVTWKGHKYDQRAILVPLYLYIIDKHDPEADKLLRAFRVDIKDLNGKRVFPSGG